MLRLAHITDPHITDPAWRLCGLHTPSLLRAALSVAEGWPGGLDGVVITGDLTHRGEPEAYAELKRCLAMTTLPVHLAIGNHDDRVAFRDAFRGEARYHDEPYVHYTVEDVKGHRLIVLDTHVPGTARGLLCGPRLDWLDRALARRPEVPTLVFLHHPPLITHLPPLDAIGLDGIDGLAAVLDRHPQVVSLHAGHIHRILHGRLGRVPVSVMTSTCHQSALDLARPDLTLTYEPPAFGLVLADGGDVVVYTVPFTQTLGPRLAYAPLRDAYDRA